MRLVFAIAVSSIAVVPIYFVLGVLSGDWPNDMWLPGLLVALLLSMVGVTDTQSLDTWMHGR